MASNRALLVAINDYGSQQNNLPSCLEDASHFRSLLEERYGFADFKELYDGDASVANVEKGLAWLFKGVAPEDRLVFFYSGHGFQQPKGGNLEECLVLGDMKFFFDDRLTELSQSAPPGVLTVVLDSCFSGGMQKRVALDGRIEIARTKAWMPPPNAMLQQQKAMMARPLVPRPFGSWQVTSSAGAKRLVLGRQLAAAGAKAAQPGAADGEDETDQLALNGLLLSACSENETASASTSATEGMSAFSYALRHVFGAAEGEPSAAELLEGARAKLQEMGFQQTPLLKAPAEPADLASMAFVTLAPAAGAGTAEAEAGEAETAEASAAAAAPRGQPAKAVAPGAAQRPARPAAGGAAPSRPAARPATGGGAAAMGAETARPDGDDSGEAPTGTAPVRPAARPAAGVSPRQQQAATSRAARAAGANATPSATTSEEEESPMDTTMQPNEQKVLGAVLGGDRIRRPSGGDPDDPAPAQGFRARRPRSRRRRRHGGGGSARRRRRRLRRWRRQGAGRGPGGDRIRRPSGGDPDDPAPAKDFAPEAPAAVVPGAGGGDAADADQKWVAALVRAVAPAAISAVPGIINAIRGRKDLHILPTPRRGRSSPALPSDWLRPARPGRGSGAPRKDFAAGDGDWEGEGDEKVLGAVLGGIASAALPEVVRMIRRRRKEFELA